MSALLQAREQCSGAHMHCAVSHMRMPLTLRYLGLYVTEIEAAIAYDTEAVAQKGILAVTNFALSGYQHLMSAPGGRYKHTAPCIPSRPSRLHGSRTLRLEDPPRGSHPEAKSCAH